MQNNEIWKDIPGYEGIYQVSSLGRIKRLRFINGKYNFKKEKLIKPVIDGGYCKVTLCKNGKYKNYPIHRLVLLTFKSDSKLQIDHINGNKQDNSLANLEYVTSKENIKRAFNIGLQKSIKEKNYNGWLKGIKNHIKNASKQVIQFNENYEIIKVYDSIADASRENNIPTGNISKCCKKEKGHITAGGYIWRYFEEEK